ncbi:hypothetical protein PTKIN_Ptkin09bG0160100 [Pterospermum kingtungense]
MATSGEYFARHTQLNLAAASSLRTLLAAKILQSKRKYHLSLMTWPWSVKVDLKLKISRSSSIQHSFFLKIQDKGNAIHLRDKLDLREAVFKSKYS